MQKYAVIQKDRPRKVSSNVDTEATRVSRDEEDIMIDAKNKLRLVLRDGSAPIFPAVGSAGRRYLKICHFYMVCLNFIDGFSGAGVQLAAGAVKIRYNPPPKKNNKKLTPLNIFKPLSFSIINSPSKYLSIDLSLSLGAFLVVPFCLLFVVLFCVWRVRPERRKQNTGLPP